MSRGQEEVLVTPSYATHHSFNCWVWGEDSWGGELLRDGLGQGSGCVSPGPEVSQYFNN